jgi:hypothetical protein
MDQGALRAALKSQYHAALAMLKNAIELCPESLWSKSGHTNECWQVAYHALFFAHMYGQPNEAAFKPWKDHVADVQYPDGIAGPSDPKSSLPLLARPYTKEQVLEHWSFCDGQIDAAVDSIDLHSNESGFWWYPIPKVEHQIVNLRHIQHHTAQLADRARTAVDKGVDWVGARRQPR